MKVMADEKESIDQSKMEKSNVEWHEDIGSVEYYHVPLNPLIHVLLDEGLTEYGINELIRLVTTKICNKPPGVTKFNSATHGAMLKIVLDAYEQSLITEDIHDLIAEDWAYTLAYLGQDGCPIRWECRHLQELVALPPLPPVEESVTGTPKCPLFGNEEDY